MDDQQPFEKFRNNDHLLDSIVYDQDLDDPNVQAANRVCRMLFETQTTTLCFPGTSQKDRERLFLNVYVAILGSEVTPEEDG